MELKAISLEIPKEVEVHIENNLVKIKGPKGEVIRTFTNPRIELIKKDNEIIISSKAGSKSRQEDKNYIYTYNAHIKNMFNGVITLYTAKLKICSGHFPMQVTIDKDILSIKNFLGEKVPRKAKIMDGVKVNIQGDIISLEGVDIEKVGQTAGRIEQTTRITKMDRRIFQDGCFIIEKPKDKK